MKLNMKKLAPYFVALGIIFIVLIVLFQPALEGKTLKQDDVVSWNANSAEARDYYDKTGEQAFWAENVFSGMPTYMITIKHVGNLFLQVDKLMRLFLPFFMGFVFIGFAGFLLFTRVLKLNIWAGIAGALAFALSSYFIVILAVGHNAKAHAIAYMAPYLIAVYMTYRGKYTLGGLLAAFFLALEIAANHIQITYYLAFVVLIFVIFEFAWAIIDKQLKRFLYASGILLAGLILAVGVNFSTLYTSYEYSKETIRGKSELTKKDANDSKGLEKSYIYGWSYGVGETFTFLVPNYAGGASQPIEIENKDLLKKVDDQQLKQVVGGWPQYWGEQPGTSGPVYVGAIVMFLFVLGLIISKHRLKWPLFIAGALSVMLAWGGNFTALSDFFVDNIPMYNKFRTPSMWLVIAELAIPFIFVLGVHELVSNADRIKQKMRALYIAFGLTGGIALLFWLSPGSFTSFYSSQDENRAKEYLKMYAGEIQKSVPVEQQAEQMAFYSDIFENKLPESVVEVRTSIFKADAMRSFLFILAAGVLVFLFLHKKIKAPVLLGALILLIAIDMIPVNKRYLNNKNFVSKKKVDKPFTPSAVDQSIMADNKDGSRVLDLSGGLGGAFNDATPSYFHRSVGGYSAAKLMRYQELIENQIYSEVSMLGANLNQGSTMGRVDSTLANLGVLNMLNTKYLILSKESAPLINNHALGHAWFVDTYSVVENADQEIARVGEINTATEAVVDKRFVGALGNLKINPDSTATIQQTSYSPNLVTYTTKAASPQLAIFSEIWYPEWELYIDGKKTDLIRANYVLRAAVIPAGEHKIEMKVHPKTFLSSTKISLASSIILLLLTAGYLVSLFLKHRKEKSVTEE